MDAHVMMQVLHRPSHTHTEFFSNFSGITLGLASPQK